MACTLAQQLDHDSGVSVCFGSITNAARYAFQARVNAPRRGEVLRLLPCAILRRRYSPLFSRRREFFRFLH